MIVSKIASLLLVSSLFAAPVAFAQNADVPPTAPTPHESLGTLDLSQAIATCQEVNGKILNRKSFDCQHEIQKAYLAACNKDSSTCKDLAFAGGIYWIYGAEWNPQVELRKGHQFELRVLVGISVTSIEQDGSGKHGVHFGVVLYPSISFKKDRPVAENTATADSPLQIFDLGSSSLTGIFKLPGAANVRLEQVYTPVVTGFAKNIASGFNPATYSDHSLAGFKNVTMGGVQNLIEAISRLQVGTRIEYQNLNQSNQQLNRTTMILVGTSVGSAVSMLQSGLQTAANLAGVKDPYSVTDDGGFFFISRLDAKGKVSGESRGIDFGGLLELFSYDTIKGPRF